MDYLRLYNNGTEHDDCYGDSECYEEPWVALIEDENKVTYNKDVLPENREAWNLFKYCFCDNVTSGDKAIFVNNVVSVSEAYVSAAKPPYYTISFTYRLSGEDRSRQVMVYTDPAQEGDNEDRTIYQCKGEENHYDSDMMEDYGRYEWIFIPDR